MRVDPIRRDYLIEQAVRAGKFPPERAGHYRTLYDRDPAGTEQALAMLAPALAGLDLPGTQEVPQAGHVNPVTPAKQGGDFSDDDVAQWSQQLCFAPRANTSRVSRADD